MTDNIHAANDLDRHVSLVRDIEEIVAAEQELHDKVWYDAHQERVAEAAEEGICAECAGLGEGEELARRLEAKYGLEELETCCSFCAGVLHGKFAALSWVLGEEWDAAEG